VGVHTLDQVKQYRHDREQDGILNQKGDKSVLDLHISSQMTVQEVDLLLSVKNFILSHEPEVLRLEEVFQFAISFEIHGGYGNEGNGCETLRLENGLHFLILGKVESTEENFSLLVHCLLVDASVLGERVNHMVVLSLYILAVVTSLMHVENYDNVVWPWILNNQLHILLGRKRDHFSTGFFLQIFHFGNFLQSKLLIDEFLLRDGSFAALGSSLFVEFLLRCCIYSDHENRQKKHYKS